MEQLFYPKITLAFKPKETYNNALGQQLLMGKVETQ